MFGVSAFSDVVYMCGGPGEQKETEIALSCGMEDGMLRWAWVPACEPDPGVAAVGSDALAGNCD